jgi:ribose 5-phosphate isomerase B
MKVAFGTDERTSLTDAVRSDLEARGHDVITAAEGEWAAVGARVGELVASGECATGVLFCWTGTGASIAANKVGAVRAALCLDASAAGGARRWNDANVLALSLRSTSHAELVEILDAWFAGEPSEDAEDRANVEHLREIERRA